MFFMEVSASFLYIPDLDTSSYRPFKTKQVSPVHGQCSDKGGGPADHLNQSDHSYLEQAHGL